ncbi:hypothetical protein BST27_13305 [Mycobacterium intermedium]|uniref:DUF732 domain-containing protein n=1 Tax=Mycobacterium intermedium TaxID=28445 RepID=A0A1E3SPG1_MYCIE|nr:DUF732 domain-containing protein [Mycobacterium intermedium]ODR03408.1 hypothetical protein BHQ20_00790 [Mycobacterium intermedium]OPE52987.1 hypothetical protein BV508_00485 [Mycobacterium intermedium]ORB05140.1 hypothetical protein BST27_13305 [Mycobacterium intermedium]
MTTVPSDRKTRTTRARQASMLLALTASVFGTAGSCAAPIQADIMGNAFLAALNNAGISYGQPVSTTALGSSVCPMAMQPNGSFDAIADNLSAGSGMSPQTARSFTIVAIATYCPALLTPLLPDRLQA